jgi:hypothetical protein
MKQLPSVYSAGDRVLLVKLLMLKHEGGFLVCNLLIKDLIISTDFVFKEGNYTYNYMWYNMNADGAAQRNQL